MKRLAYGYVRPFFRHTLNLITPVNVAGTQVAALMSITRRSLPLTSFRSMSLTTRPSLVNFVMNIRTIIIRSLSPFLILGLLWS